MAMADMMGTLMRGMGIDADAIMAQAAALNAHFNRLASALHQMSGQLEALERTQTAIALHLGVTMPPMSDEQVEMVARKTAEALAPYGGALPPPDVEGETIDGETITPRLRAAQ